MPRTRQQPSIPRAASDATWVVRSLALGLGPGARIDGHAHAWPQLVFARTGVVQVETAAAAWVVPPLRAVWVPAATEHALWATGDVALRTVYVRPDLASTVGNGTGCRVLHVGELLRALILRVVDCGALDDAVAVERRLAAVLVDELATAPTIGLELVLPRDPRARRLAERVRAAPGGTEPLDVLARRCGASSRTFERLFRAETGMTFGTWRRQVRLLHAIGRLAAGRSVTEAALDAGYDSVSAFIAMFRSAVGETPGRFVATGRETSGLAAGETA